MTALRHTCSAAVLGTLLTSLLATTLPTTAFAAPATHTLRPAIEGFAPYQPQTTCSPTAKPGTVALRTIVMKAYGGTGDYGIVRSCASGGRSEHKEGRAWDWKVNAANPAQVRQVNDMLRWLFATDKYGNTYAMARRLGIMYLIWNHRIWSAWSHSWKAYHGSDPHTSHVHFSLAWAGAMKKSSYWTGTVAPTLRPPAQPPVVRPPVVKPPVVRPPVITPPVVRPPVVPPVVPPVGEVSEVPGALTTSAVLTVASTSHQALTSAFTLVQGHRYLLLATGVYHYGPGAMLADAECAARPADLSWQRRSAWEDAGSWQGPAGHLDLTVQDEATRWRTASGSSCDLSTHTYGMVLEPQVTGPLSLRVNDDDLRDNSGSLTVTVRPL